MADDIDLAHSEHSPGELEAALERIDRILERDPTDIHALRLQAQLRERLCWTSGVLDPEDRLIDLCPSESETRRLIGLHRRSFNGDRALALLDRLSERDFSWEVDRVEILIECRRFREAVVIADRLSVDPRVEVESVLHLARLCLDAADAPRAVKLAQRALELAPRNVDALLLSGRLALWGGDFDRARGLAERIPDSDRLYQQALQLKGQCELVARNVPSAIRLFEAALDSGKPNLETLICLAEARRLNGETRVARTLLRRARSLQREYSFALEANELLVLRAQWRMFAFAFGFFSPGNRADLLSTLCALNLLDSGRDTGKRATLARLLCVLEDALTSMSGNRSPVITRRSPAQIGFECVQAGPSERSACVEVHRILCARGFEAALAAYDQLLSDYGDSPLVYTHRGEYFLWVGQYEAARSDFEAALRCLPGARWAWVGLGASFVLSGDPKRALVTFARGRWHAAPATVTQVYAGEALRALGWRRAALAAFRRARALNPERPSVHLNLAIAHAELRDAVHLDRDLSTLRRLIPNFYRSLLHETGNSEASFTADLDRCRAALIHGWKMMRGNRSRTLVTWFGADGRAHYGWAGGHSSDEGPS